MIYGKTLPVRKPIDEPVEKRLVNASSAQLEIWLAQAQRDHGMISDEEMRVVEKIAGTRAKRSITMFNPFTMERRKVELP